MGHPAHSEMGDGAAYILIPLCPVLAIAFAAWLWLRVAKVIASLRLVLAADHRSRPVDGYGTRQRSAVCHNPVPFFHHAAARPGAADGQRRARCLAA